MSGAFFCRRGVTRRFRSALTEAAFRKETLLCQKETVKS